MPYITMNENERIKLVMRERRKIDKNYGREKARKNAKEE